MAEEAVSAAAGGEKSATKGCVHATNDAKEDVGVLKQTLKRRRWQDSMWLAPQRKHNPNDNQLSELQRLIEFKAERSGFRHGCLGAICRAPREALQFDDSSSRCVNVRLGRVQALSASRSFATTGFVMGTSPSEEWRTLTPPTSCKCARHI